MCMAGLLVCRKGLSLAWTSAQLELAWLARDQAGCACMWLDLQDPSMWATLASMAIDSKELNTAEAAFAEVDEVDKLHFVMKVSCAVLMRKGQCAVWGWHAGSIHLTAGARTAWGWSPGWWAEGKLHVR